MILGIYALRTILIFHGVPFWSNIHISNPWAIMKCPNFHGINFRHITHGTKSSALLFIESYKKKWKPSLTQSLRPHDPISFPWLQYCLHFHSLFFISLPPSLIPCMFPTTNVHKNHHNKKWKMHTNFVPIFFFLCVEPWTLKYHLHQSCWQMGPITRHPH